MKKFHIINLTFLIVFHLSGKILAQQISISQTKSSESFTLVDSEILSELVVDTNDAEVVSIAATALSEDIKLITGTTPPVKNSITGSSPVIIGTLGKSELIDSLVKTGKISTDNIIGKWETFCISIVDNPFGSIERALIIYGSDPRGTAFGVFEFSKLMGISPWVWWADVNPENHTTLYVNGTKSVFGPPSVEYRGIFLNDEDWGLQPWAAQNIDTDIKDIGPQTYAKIFELMLRCKANYIWPAMHPSTKAFWYYPGNPKMAKKYEIVLGSSHAEPMLRNNVDEWKNNFEEEYGFAPGEWCWTTNKDQILTYWTDRVLESKDQDAIYTVGMRGIHDSSIPCISGNDAKRLALKDIITTQRNMIETTTGKSAMEVPQLLCPYKEVLDIYRMGIDLADDVTLLWVDDNYGYVRQLSNPAEQTRSGGSGVYYHFSYWGWPEDYLWVSTISPSLSSYELLKSYELGADKIWIVNVGDIKPNEMEMQFALDLAWDITTWTPDKAHEYSTHWAAETFGSNLAEDIGKLKQQFYFLAATGKPEQIHKISFSEQDVLQRLQAYDTLVANCDKIKTKVPGRLEDAFFQLIEYPIKGTAYMNAKILGARLSHSYARQGREDALVYSKMAIDAYDEIVSLTNIYNKEIASGKWDKMMDYAPRGLNNFYAPNVASIITQTDIPSAKEDSIMIIPANHFKSINGNSYTIQTFKGLGSEGNSIGVWPMNMENYNIDNITSVPFVEYEIPVKKGMNNISVRCLPNFPLYEDKQLRFAISIDGSEPEFVNIESTAETSLWATNILRGYTKTDRNFASLSDQIIKIHIYLTDPGLVVSGLTVQNVSETIYTAKLINANFELKAENEYNDGATVRGIPYGWSSEGALGGNSFGINSDGSNFSGSNLCWINSTPMPDKYELYQEIEGLPAGEYIVRCRLAVNKSDALTNQRLFANNNVQYFGSAENYTFNLTGGETNTFSGYKPDGYNLKEMAVKVAVFDGDTLRLGIRSSNKKGNGTSATDNAGWFKTDHFRIELFRKFEDIAVEKGKLDSLITVATNLYDSTNSGTLPGYYPENERETFFSAIQSANSVSKNQDAVLQEILNEITNISKAIEKYRNSLITWNAYLVNPDFEYKAEGELNDGSTVRGIPYGWNSYGNLLGNSFGINNDGINYNGSNLCWINSTPMPQEFELYQTVDSLPAGEYTVRCRLAVMNNTVTNQRLFANNNVQYFGKETDYVSNLNAEENNTFAGWIPSASYSLKEMTVSVTIEKGDSLKLGIRSSNLLSNGTAASNNAGWFKVDNFNLELDSLFTTEQPNSLDQAKNETKIVIANISGGFSVSIDNYYENGKLWLYNVNGKLILQEELKSAYSLIEISKPGLYIAKIVINGKATTKKVTLF